MFKLKELTIQTFDDTKQERKELAQIFLYDKERVEKLQVKIAGAFYCINPQENPNVRTVNNTKEWAALGLDVDVAKEEEHLSNEQLEQKKKESLLSLEELEIPPNYVGITKNGLNAIWLWKEPIKLLDISSRKNANDEYQQLIKGFGEKTGIEYDKSGNNLVRVFRLPDSLHQKDPKNPFKIQFKAINPDKVDFERFKKLYLPVKPEALTKNIPFDFSTAFGAKTGTRNEVLKHAIPSLLNKHDVEAAWLFTVALNNSFPEPLSETELKYKFEKFRMFVENNPLPSPYEGLISHNSLISQPYNYPEAPSDEAFTGLAGEIVKAIEPNSESDPVALLINFLIAFGSVIGNSAFKQIEASKHHMKLFAVIVGESAKGRKGTSWGYIEKIFESVDPQWAGNRQSGLSSGEGLIWAVRDEIKKTKTNKDGETYEEIIDPGISDKRLLVLEGEFSKTLRVMGREGNTLSTVIRDAWEKGDLNTLTKNSPAKSTGAHISIIGHISKFELLRYLTDVEMSNGFGNRFIWIMSKRSKCLPFGGKNIDFTQSISKLKNAVDYAKSIGEVDWAEETKSIWAAIYPELSEGKPGLTGSILNRGEAYVTRLACIYTLLDEERLIKPHHLQSAMALWEYVERSVKFIFQNSTGDPLVDEISELILKSQEGITRNEIMNYFSRHKTSDQIDIALKALEQMGRARKADSPTGGRPAEKWFNTAGEISEESEKRPK